MVSSRVETHKLVLIGDPGVGKTSLRKRYLGEGFSADYSMTIGADFGVKEVTKGEKSFIFQIWDLSGQLSFQAVRKLYYNNVTSLLITFDLTSHTSLQNIKSWFKEYIQVGADLNISCILIGNKEDLMYDIPVELMREIELSKEFIESHLEQKVELFVTSALSGFNVDSAFSWLIDQIIDKEKRSLQN